MDTKDPLIEAAAAHLSEEVPWVYKDFLRNGGDRVQYLVSVFSSGNEEDATKQAYEWVKTGVLNRADFHRFIHTLVA